MSKYIDDALARRALEAASDAAGQAMMPVPFVWTGADWTTPGGEWRDLPLIRRGMGEWLADQREQLRFIHGPAIKAAEQRADLEQRASLASLTVAAFEAGARAELERQAAALRRKAASIEVPPMPVGLDAIDAIGTVASEILSASSARAAQLLALASQFDAFRAPMNDPAAWVKRLGAVPRGVHVRTSAVWDAFTVTEPVLARSLGTVAGKRALFAAMDRRFGARRKLAGYEGWRGVALPDTEHRLT